MNDYFGELYRNVAENMPEDVYKIEIKLDRVCIRDINGKTILVPAITYSGETPSGKFFEGTELVQTPIELLGTWEGFAPRRAEIAVQQLKQTLEKRGAKVSVEKTKRYLERRL